MRGVPGHPKCLPVQHRLAGGVQAKGRRHGAGQQDIARKVLGQDFQKVFSTNKGSIPVRNDMLADMGQGKSGFDVCAETSAKDFLADARNGGLQPSMAHNMATTLAVQGAFFDVVTNYINDPKADPTDAAKKLAAAVKAAK